MVSFHVDEIGPIETRCQHLLPVGREGHPYHSIGVIGKRTHTLSARHIPQPRRVVSESGSEYVFTVRSKGPTNYPVAMPAEYPKRIVQAHRPGQGSVPLRGILGEHRANAE